MNEKELLRQHRRIIMDVEQCLHASNALRNRDDIFGSHPFGALGAGICLSSLVCMINGEFVTQPNWPKEIFPALGKGNPYSWLVGWELLAVGQVLVNNPEIFKLADEWAGKVYKGDDSAKFLEDIGLTIGEKALNHIMGRQQHLGVLEPDQVGYRAMVMFKAGVEIQGDAMNLAIERDPSHIRVAGFAELALMTSTTYQYLIKRAPFAEIGNSRYITDLVDSTVYDGAMFNAVAPVCRKMDTQIGPGMIMEMVNRLYGPKISLDIDDSLRAIDRIFEAQIQALQAASGRQDTEVAA